MDSEDIAVIRERVQQAQSRARLAPDANAKAEWDEIAAAWLEVLKATQDEVAPPTAPSFALHAVRGAKV